MNDTASTTTAARSPLGSLGRLPLELILMMTEYLCVPPIPSDFGSSSKSISRISRLGVLNKAWNQLVSENEAGSVSVRLYDPTEADVRDHDSNASHHNENDDDVLDQLYIASDAVGCDDQIISNDSFRSSRIHPRLRKDTIVIPIGKFTDPKATWTVIRNCAFAVADLLDEATQDISAYQKVGMIVMDSRITPLIPDSDRDMSASEIMYRVRWTKGFALSARLATLVSASLHVEAHIFFRPLIRSELDFVAHVPSKLTLSSKSFQTPKWSKSAVVPKHVGHVYSLDLTRSLFVDPHRSWSATFGNTLRDKVEIMLRTASKGTGPRNRILFHLWVDQTDQTALEEFAKVPFTQIFETHAPNDLRNDRKMTLRLNGESVVPELPYSVVGQAPASPL